MALCNQGCKTHVYWHEGKVYNVSDNEPHDETCMSLKIGKWWGGYYNTISIDRIKDSLVTCQEMAKDGDRMTIKQLVTLVNALQSELEYVMRQIRDQERWNEVQKKEFAEYKTNLVAEQTLREERKRSKRKERFEPETDGEQSTL